MILVVVGPTGVGKTKLSISLAKRYNAEVINGDAIQVYKGLDIGSAKVREDEKDGGKDAGEDRGEAGEDGSVILEMRCQGPATVDPGNSKGGWRWRGKLIYLLI